jgi:tripartite-type tricarboxylate transporter receptor subunit TctC
VKTVLRSSLRYGSIAATTLLASMLLATAVIEAEAQTDRYPDRPVQIVLDAAVGASPDVGLRLVADGLSQIWGQQVVAVNRPGGGGSLAARSVAAAEPDGYTLYQAVMSSFVALNAVPPVIPINVPKDFIPVGFVTEIPMFIAASSTLGVSSLPELIALAKKNPGKVSSAVTGVGRLTHLTGVLLENETGIKLLSVPYKGGPAQAFADVTSGRVGLVVDGYSSLAGAVSSGSLKILAVALDERLPDFPDVPTVAETIPGFRATGWAVLLAPPGTPEAIVRKISEGLAKVSSQPELQQRLAKLGAKTNPLTPAETTAFITQQQKTWEPVLKAIRAEETTKP